MMHLMAALIASAVVLMMFAAVLAAHIGTSEVEDLEWERYRCELE